MAFIKSSPGISAPDLSATTASELASNRERQHEIERRNEGREDGLPAKDRRELEALVREERTLQRRERLAAEAQGEDRNIFVKAWIKISAVLRPIKLLGGILLLLLAILIWVSMILSFADKAKNSTCKHRCGYVLAHTQIFQPINYILTVSAKVFPIDYIVFLILALYFFSSSVVGITAIGKFIHLSSTRVVHAESNFPGIRFLWVTLFSLRKSRTTPQALLLSTILLAHIVLAIIYALATIVAPQYAHFGPQTFCDRPLRHPDDQPDCSEHHKAVKPCTEATSSQAAANVCTASVGSVFLDRITLNFSFFGAIDFWAQIAFFAIFLVVFVTSLFRTPRLDFARLDQDAEEDEEEGLLASTQRRFGATWQDITGRAKTAGNGEGSGGQGSA